MARNGGKPVNGNNSTTAKAETLPDKNALAVQWNGIDWHKVEYEVNRLQTRIAKAVKEGKWNKVKRLQYLITHSYYAKLLAVHKVTTNKGKKTPGIDKVVWHADSDKMKAAISLSDKGYKAKPLRRVYIEKKNKKAKRPLGIPSMYDRAMQALYTTALQPIAETMADRSSFGFRKYRSCQDACEQIFNCVSRKYSAQWILEGDIKGCFDHISHQWLIDNIPMDKSVLKQFLKAGYIFQDRLFPTDEGTPQGGIISPILANMTLDGIQGVLTEKYDLSPTGCYSRTIHSKHKVNFIRYADDFIVTASTKEIAEEVKILIKGFLSERGLELSDEKTLITNINEGFDLLGWTFRKFKNKLIIKPSAKSVRSLTDTLSDLIKRHGQSMTQEVLIYRLNQILTGWGNYHKYVCSKEVFQKIDHQVHILLWKWGCHRHHNKGRKWIKAKYWHSEGHRNWVFSTGNNQLKKLGYIPIKRYPNLNLTKNPYLDREYFLKRQQLKGKKFQLEQLL